MENDDPPPLENMTELLKKMHLDIGQQSFETISANPSKLLSQESIQNVPKKQSRRTEDKTSLVSIQPDNHVLITNDTPKQDLPNPTIKPFQKGFLNTTSKKSKPKARPKETVQEEIPFIKATKSKERDNIPDFMRVQADPERIALQKEVREMLQPTEELVKDVMETSDISNGLKDPEIMAAVSEIADNPDAMHKYKHNKKVTTFYNHLGILMKDRIDKQENIGKANINNNKQCNLNKN